MTLVNIWPFLQRIENIYLLLRWILKKFLITIRTCLIFFYSKKQKITKSLQTVNTALQNYFNIIIDLKFIFFNGKWGQIIYISKIVIGETSQTYND